MTVRVKSPSLISVDKAFPKVEVGDKILLCAKHGESLVQVVSITETKDGRDIGIKHLRIKEVLK